MASNVATMRDIHEVKERLNAVEQKLDQYFGQLHQKSTDDIGMCEEALAELGDIIYAE